MRSLTFSCVIALALMGAAAPLAAQTGTLLGQVVDAETGEPLEATIQVQGAGQADVAGAVSGTDGRFRFELPAGSYTVVASRLGYDSRRVPVEVAAAGSRDVQIAMVSRAVQLNPIVVTASRGEEKQLDAPASIVFIDQAEIREQAAPTVIEHVKGQPGVDVAQTGLQQANVVTRGFNNVFSGAMLVLTDNRYAAVPSLRVNAYNFIPTTNLDLDHIEVLLGPAAALYGPNSASGVLHMLTTSPIDDPGTQFSVAGGERSIFHGEFRHAALVGESSGIKISGQYFRGEDFEFEDPAEAAARAAALPADPDTQVGLRNFDAERYSVDARFDTRPWDDGELVLAAGANVGASSIELTGVGAAQADHWTYSYGQVRLRKGRLFAQSFINMSDAGDSYLLRTGQNVIDNSFMLAGQVQHGFALGERQDFVYGVDLQKTEPRTDMTITGRNEDDDTINEAGGYIHSETRLTDNLEFVGAARLDWHNRLEDLVFSPRAALVLRPAPDQNLRLTFNRAFSTPTTNNLFLDLFVQRIPIAGDIGYDIRTRGTPESGFTFSRSCPGGFDGGLCMRSPFAPGQPVPASAALAWNSVLNALVAAGQIPAALLPVLQSDLPPIMTVLRRLNPETGTFDLDAGPTDIERLTPTVTNTIEVGYKGLIGGRVLLAADVYRSDIQDFITPLRVETPNVFFDPSTTSAFLVQRLTPLVQAGALTPEALTAIVTQATTLAARIPLGTIGPDQSDTSDILLAYRNFGELDLWGADFVAEALLTDTWSMRGSYSWVSEECFDFDENGTCEDLLDVAL
ncbi:MAG TPA: TonB-dependent receptor, partial [Gemmatimonadota bacterium]|nr:TonB-dependent receptor [Gemmatimonadota bacterium]